MPGLLNENDWNLLLRRIEDGECTAFLGAGACSGVLPLGAEIAARWAEDYHYPLEDCHDLARVSQYLATIEDSYSPKKLVAKYIKGRITEERKLPDFNEADEPHAVLADLPLPVYITTNYDDFMVRALKDRRRNPRQELCRWNERIREQPSVFESEKTFVPTAEQPVVFHLHGHYQVADSIVLTEDDYLDFIVNVASDRRIIPAQIRDALTMNSLLFLGYRIADWNFRVLFRGLVARMEGSGRRKHVSVQLAPLGETHTPEQKERAQEYLDRYFNGLDVRVYWGNCREFAADLRRRWCEFQRARRRIPDL